MNAEKGQLSPSGVFIAEDFRENLIIDRYDPVFADMRASKLKHLRSANSEDAVTWNVFRSLRQLAPRTWLPSLWKYAFSEISCPADLNAVVKLWESVSPPLGLLAGGDEGASEIDAVIETPTWVWFIEAKYRSDISTGTTMRPDRDQILRNIDVGSYWAGTRDFFFSLLITSEKLTPEGVRRIREYEDLSAPRAKLSSHRPDGLRNMKAISLLTWHAAKEVLKAASQQASRDDERAYADRALSWLKRKGL